MPLIKLPEGLYTFVDDIDYERISMSKWTIKRNKNDVAYARTYSYGMDGISMQNFILGVPGTVDHIDGDSLNNSRSNLRSCSHSSNCQNARMRKNKQVQAKGVRMHGNKFSAVIKANKIQFSLGNYGDKDIAAHAYNKAAVKLHGEFARLNPIGVDPRSPV